MSHPKDNKILDILAAVVDSLRETEVRYMIIGAWALAVWGRPRATMDLDFMVMVDERGLARLEERLIREGFSVDDTWLEANPMLKNSMRRMWFRGVTVDLMRPRDIQDAQALERRKRRRLAGRFCWFVAPEDFILQKLKTGRPRDIEDALSVLARSQELLDFKYLDRWARRLDLAAEWKYVLGECAACLTNISQAETALRKTSFAGSAKSSRAFVESSAASVIIHRKVHVSRSSFTSLRLRKAL